MKNNALVELSVVAAGLVVFCLITGCDHISEEPGGGAFEEASSEERSQNAVDAFFGEQQSDLGSRVPLGCIAPSREDYMARFGFTVDDRDLSNPKVVSAREHTVLFIFDKSGSMSGLWNNEGTKWEIARASMISSVKPFQSYVTVGAIFFPYSDEDGEVAYIDSGLQINYSKGPNYLEQWENNMDQYGAEGSTPLMSALFAADHAIAVACDSGILEKPFKVVLITDGEPDYYDQQVAIALVSSWFALGIETQVIGMPGSTAAASILADITYAGGSGENILFLADEEAEEIRAEIEQQIIYTEGENSSGFTNDLTIAID